MISLGNILQYDGLGTNVEKPIAHHWSPIKSISGEQIIWNVMFFFSLHHDMQIGLLIGPNCFGKQKLFGVGAVTSTSSSLCARRIVRDNRSKDKRENMFMFTFAIHPQSIPIEIMGAERIGLSKRLKQFLNRNRNSLYMFYRNILYSPYWSDYKKPKILEKPPLGGGFFRNLFSDLFMRGLK